MHYELSKQLLWDWPDREKVQIWGCWRTVMKWCSWIYQWWRARRFTPGQAPLLWRTACSAEPVRWVWCQTWAQCCSTCPAIPPGQQNKRRGTKSHSWFCSEHFLTAAEGRLEDVTQIMRDWERGAETQSCVIIILMLDFLHVRFRDVMQIKAVSCWPGIDSHRRQCCWQRYELTWMSAAVLCYLVKHSCSYICLFFSI